jgi:hypothetical protein
MILIEWYVGLKCNLFYYKVIFQKTLGVCNLGIQRMAKAVKASLDSWTSVLGLKPTLVWLDTWVRWLFPVTLCLMAQVIPASKGLRRCWRHWIRAEDSALAYDFLATKTTNLQNANKIIRVASFSKWVPVPCLRPSF